jgi:hypothetical protein
MVPGKLFLTHPGKEVVIFAAFKSKGQAKMHNKKNGRPLKGRPGEAFYFQWYRCYILVIRIRTN